MNDGIGALRHIALDVVGSTNDEAMIRAIAGADLPLWVTAERQTGGRGRQGVYWASEKGNLFASLALGVAPGSRLSDLPIIASVALFDALCAHLSDEFAARLAIKWPNDILFGGRKVCGILAESQSDGAGGFHAVVGFGVNLGNHPAETRYPATDFASEGVVLDSRAIFRALATCVAERLAQWQNSADGGFQKIRTDWLARASGIGHRIEVRLPGETLSGKFQDMDDEGRLILRLLDGDVREISAGDVFFAQRDQVGSSDGQ